MKMKALVAVILAVVLLVAFAVPVFADQGGNPNPNASDKAVGASDPPNGYGQVVKMYATDPGFSIGERRKAMAHAATDVWGDAANGLADDVKWAKEHLL